MLSKLIKYEFVKRWKASRYVLLGYVLLQALLLVMTRSFFWNSGIIKVFTENDTSSSLIGVPFGLAMMLYFLLAVFIGLFPFIEGLYRYDKDLSGKQSTLELMMPVNSWKKIVSKLITVLCSTLIGFGLATLSVITFILVNSNFDKRIVDEILKFFQSIFQSPINFILNLLYILFNLLSVYMIIFCCIAISKSISHKNRIAVPIGIMAFILIIAALAALNGLMLMVPLVEFSIFNIVDSLSSMIMSLLVFLGTLSGTSWLMENKVEH